MILASDDWYANHNRFEERRHWLSHKIGQLQPSPLRLGDLEAILRSPRTPSARLQRHPNRQVLVQVDPARTGSGSANHLRP